ncbi:UNVERIFIED_CONTAM: hypothetical protein GTU68_021113, partial [Idotea baltica]|nr:hypothetical protein [Idotea baltica]
MWTSQYWNFRHPYTWINSGGLGTMGFSIPAAIGAKTGMPERTVWSVDGDGCFQMTAQELVTASAERIPIKVAILNNAYLGMVRQWQELLHHVLSVLVENRAGVLARVASLFARRSYNIYSLAVAPTDDPTFSRITIVVDAESAPLEQIVKQLNKLIHVIKISELDPRDSVERELMLVTIRATADVRSQVVELVGIFDGKIIDTGHDELTVSLGETPDRLD